MIDALVPSGIMIFGKAVPVAQDRRRRLHEIEPCIVCNQCYLLYLNFRPLRLNERPSAPMAEATVSEWLDRAGCDIL